MSANNSISQLLEQFLELNTNSLETFNRINEAISTDKQTVTIDLYDPSNEGSIKSVQIPAFGYLKREIERLNKNLESITDVEKGSANVRLKDGTYRKLFTSKLKGPSAPITSLAAPTHFNIKSNEFFEDFLNPLLTIKLDVSGQIPVETERVYIERFIFDGTDSLTLERFKEVYKGESEIKYADLESDIAENDLKYHIDSEVIEMPTRAVQYFGKFDVVKITNEQRSQLVDGLTRTKTIKLFTVDKLSYSDASKSLKDTEVLKVNDSLVVNSGKLRTRYLIKSIDNSTSQLELELIEGYESIKVGAQMLSVYREIDSDLDIEINVGFDERQVIFIKPIDSLSNIPAEEYSPGVSFYSNELLIDGADGKKQTLSSYYRDEVADFGQFIKSLNVDYIPPSSVGVVPSSPVLSVDNLKVVQINKHLTNNTTTQKIQQLKSDKIAEEQNLKNLNESIKQKKTLLSTKKFKSTVERDKQRNELSSQIAVKAAATQLYSSIVTEIKSSAESSDLNTVSPKFRVRGFWPIPDPIKIGEDLSQEIVQFKIRYRYISTSGKTSQVEQIEFNDSNSQTSKTAAFSNWVEIDGPIRKREKGEDGKYKWITESEEDAQAVNFNSIDIPINSGEFVEIMVKSISEAGFPANPVTSDWSDIVKVGFPDGELSTESLSDLVSSNNLDAIKVDINNDLTSAGVFEHISDNFTAGDKYFAHSANSLASGFLTQEQSPISIYDKLLELQNEITRLRAQIEGAIGELTVEIIDEDGNVTPITNNSRVKLFAGYYTEELPETNYKGHIVTKNFKIKLSNNQGADLELIARILGDTSKPSWISSTDTTFGLGSGTVDPVTASDSYYTNEGRYDLVPVVYQNLELEDLIYDYFNEGPEQSTQLRGQFLYSRFKNIANDDTLYIDDQVNNIPNNKSGFDLFEYGVLESYGITGVSDVGTNGCYDFGSAVFTASNVNGNNTIDYIWKGNAGSSDVNTLADMGGSVVYDSNILVHVDHPAILENPLLDILDLQSNGFFSIPKTASLRASEINGKKQTPFKLTVDSKSTDPNTPPFRRSIKTSFEPNDQYLLGGKSCGSFLYLSPLDVNSHVVDANNKSGKKVINANGTNSVIIDLVFQYRMTDYNGPGDTGTGRIAGTLGTTYENLTYCKKIGIDILDSQDKDFKFDLEVFAKYKTTGKNINSITSSMLSNFISTSGASGGGIGGSSYIQELR